MFIGYLIRAPTVDVLYVSNVKYLAHLAHQIPFDPIYQMCHISYFLQYATVESQICHGTKQVWHMDLFFFYSSFSLIYLSSSPSAIHRLHLHSLTCLFLLLLQLFTASLSTLPYSFFFPFPFCSLSPLCSISDAADSLFSFSPSYRFKNLKVADFLSILSQSLPIRCSLFSKSPKSSLPSSIRYSR